MKNKKLLNIGYLLTLVALVIFFTPKALAAYDCAVSYPGSDSVSPFTYDACCYPASAEPYQGVYCRPDNSVVRKSGSNPPVCSAYSEVLTLATSARNLSRLGFNCFDGTINSQCRANFCKNSAGTCVAISGVTCPSNLNRLQICPGGCGACKEGYVYCVDSQPANLPNETSSPTLSCQPINDGKNFPANSSKTCAELGRDILNPCTGQCTDCPAGRTLSGRYEGVCVTYGVRFIEIFKDGLTWLGGQPWDPNKDGTPDDFDGDGIPEMHAYDYSETGPVGLASVFLKADMAEVLNWNSRHLPQELKWLLSNYNLCTVHSDCGTGELCSQGGLCYNPSGNAGSACTDNSDCNIIQGLTCDVSTGKCVLSTGSSPYLNFSSEFVGLSNTVLDGNRGGYVSADTVCSGKFAGSHVCSSKEIINSYVIGASALSGVTEIAWINVAAPGNIEPLVNDCKGWADNNSYPFFATVWNFNLKMAGIQPCNATKKFACCK